MLLKKATVLALTIILGILLSASTILATTAHDWLTSQQNSTTRLIDSYEGDGSIAAYTHDPAREIRLLI